MVDNLLIYDFCAAKHLGHLHTVQLIVQVLHLGSCRHNVRGSPMQPKPNPEIFKSFPNIRCFITVPF